MAYSYESVMEDAYEGIDTFIGGAMPDAVDPAEQIDSVSDTIDWLSDPFSSYMQDAQDASEKQRIEAGSLSSNFNRDIGYVSALDNVFDVAKADVYADAFNVSESTKESLAHWDVSGEIAKTSVEQYGDIIGKRIDYATDQDIGKYEQDFYEETVQAEHDYYQERIQTAADIDTQYFEHTLGLEIEYRDVVSEYQQEDIIREGEYRLDYIDLVTELNAELARQEAGYDTELASLYATYNAELEGQIAESNIELAKLYSDNDRDLAYLIAEGEKTLADYERVTALTSTALKTDVAYGESYADQRHEVMGTDLLAEGKLAAAENLNTLFGMFDEGFKTSLERMTEESQFTLSTPPPKDYGVPVIEDMYSVDLYGLTDYNYVNEDGSKMSDEEMVEEDYKQGREIRGYVPVEADTLSYVTLSADGGDIHTPISESVVTMQERPTGLSESDNNIFNWFTSTYNTFVEAAGEYSIRRLNDFSGDFVELATTATQLNNSLIEWKESDPVRYNLTMGGITSVFEWQEKNSSLSTSEINTALANIANSDVSDVMINGEEASYDYNRVMTYDFAGIEGTTDEIHNISLANAEEERLGWISRNVRDTSTWSYSDFIQQREAELAPLSYNSYINWAGVT